MSTTQKHALIFVRDRLPVDPREQMIAELRAGLGAAQKSIPTKYLYDARGSELFEEITKLPEYYLTRTEQSILEDCADDMIELTRPQEIVELGSGSSRKTQLLLEAMHRAKTGSRYVPLDVSEDALIGAADRLTDMYDWLQVQGVVGEFISGLANAPRSGRRLIAFLGSTIGNLYPNERVNLYKKIADNLQEDDYFLVGYDLLKDEATIHAAYNDNQGVTEKFSHNVLVVLNRQLGADFVVDDFDHVAELDPETGWVLIGLRAKKDMVVQLPAAAGMRVHLREGELIRTEISSKFRRSQVVEELRSGGLMLKRWYTDPRKRFALGIACARNVSRRA